MLQPKRSKFRKHQTGRIKGLARRGSKISFGDYAIVSVGRGRITSRQIEAARMAIQRKTRRQGTLHIRIFPDKPITKKPLETRMGKGKGPVDHWVCLIKPGRILFEIKDVSEDLARQAFRLAGIKLPLKTVFRSRENQL